MITPTELSRFTTLLEHRDPFALSRFGDGEWHAVLGDAGQTRDGQEYDPALGSTLRRSLLAAWAPPFHYATGRYCLDHLGPRLRDWLARHRLELAWWDADVFRAAGIAGQLTSFVAALQQRHLVYVGPERLRTWVLAHLGARRYVAVPAVNAFTVGGDVFRQLLAVSDDVVAFSCGPLANVLVDHLWHASSEQLTLIDCGSVWDPYAGIASRSDYGQHDWARLARVNFGG